MANNNLDPVDQKDLPFYSKGEVQTGVDPNADQGVNSHAWELYDNASAWNDTNNKI